MKALLIVLGGLALLVLMPVESGFVFSVLWSWFVVPQFHLASLNIPEAIGLSGIIALLTYQVDGRDRTEKEKTTALWVNLIYPFIALLFGFIVHLFL